MPPLSNSRREKFAQGRVSGMSADAAYRAAGYRPCRQSASRLLSNADVLARIAELQGPLIEKVQFDTELRLQLLAGIALDESKDPRARVAAIHEANKMLGAHASQQMNVRHSFVDLTDDELAEALAQAEMQAATYTQ